VLSRSYLTPARALLALHASRIFGFRWSRKRQRLRWRSGAVDLSISLTGCGHRGSSPDSVTAEPRTPDRAAIVSDGNAASPEPVQDLDFVSRPTAHKHRGPCGTAFKRFAAVNRGGRGGDRIAKAPDNVYRRMRCYRHIEAAAGRGNRGAVNGSVNDVFRCTADAGRLPRRSDRVFLS
jgi:hypothetical protein